MGPLLGPLAGALLAAFVAGLALGVVRLRRLSLDWLKRRAARHAAGRAAGPDAAAVAVSADAPEPADPDAAVAPPVFGALFAAAFALAVIVLVALSAGAPARVAVTPFDVLAPVPSLLLFALLVPPCTVALGLLALALDAAVHAALVAIGRAPAGATPPPEVRDLVAAARGLLPGTATAPASSEPFGVGLAYVVLAAATAMGVGGLLQALGLLAPGAPAARAVGAPVALTAVGLLAVPLCYAAAAERSGDPLRARLRRDAAIRQLVAAPLWGLALAAFVARPGPAVALGAALLLALAGAVALPGAAAAIGPVDVPRGGDLAEPSAAVRALTGLAHGAWIVVGAVLPAVVLAAASGESVAAGVGGGGLALVSFLALRALVPRRTLPAAA